MENINDLSELGQRIKKARKDAKLTQSELSELCDISITQISSYENGRRSVGLYSLYKIAKATGKTMDEIFAGSQSMKPITSANNKGELIVNCITSLFDEHVISVISPNYESGYGGYNFQNLYQIIFTNYADVLTDLINKLDDFDNDKTNYPDPNNFKKQLLAAAAKRINKTK